MKFGTQNLMTTSSVMFKSITIVSVNELMFHVTLSL